MGMSISHLLLIVIVVFIIFGAGKLPKVMGDLGKGIRNLKDGLNGDDEADEKAKIEEQKEVNMKEK
jgi:sec-independent protein translocase protein TatA